MVFPPLETITHEGNVVGLIPRLRLHCQRDGVDSYEVFLNALPNQQLKRSTVARKIFEKFAGVLKIYHISLTKIKIVFDSAANANNLISSDWKNNYAITVPFKSVEVRGRIPIQNDISEEYIFHNLKPYEDNCSSKILEVRRIILKNKDSGADEFISESVIVTFEGTRLPEYVKLDNLLIPVQPQIDRIVQCRNCWKYGHNANSCRGRAKCVTCGSVSKHEFCDDIPCCSNCNGPHSANSRDCPFFLIRKKKQILAYTNEKKSNFIFNDNDFPPLNTPEKKLVNKSTQSIESFPVKIMCTHLIPHEEISIDPDSRSNRKRSKINDSDEDNSLVDIEKIKKEICASISEKLSNLPISELICDSSSQIINNDQSLDLIQSAIRNKINQYLEYVINPEPSAGDDTPFYDTASITNDSE